MLCSLIAFLLIVVLLVLLALSVAGTVTAVAAGGSPARMLELALMVRNHFKRRA